MTIGLSIARSSKYMEYLTLKLSSFTVLHYFFKKFLFGHCKNPLCTNPCVKQGLTTNKDTLKNVQEPVGWRRMILHDLSEILAATVKLFASQEEKILATFKNIHAIWEAIEW